MFCLSNNPNLDWQFVLDHPKGLNDNPWKMKGLSGNPNLDWQFVLDNLDGLNGKSWSMFWLSRNSLNTSKKVFFSLPFTQKEFKDELIFMKEEIKYRPGNRGFQEAQQSFNDNVQL